MPGAAKGNSESDLVQGSLFQLATYMLTIALFVVGVALLLPDWHVAWHRPSSSSLQPFSRRSAEEHRTSGRHSLEAPVCRRPGPALGTRNLFGR